MRHYVCERCGKDCESEYPQPECSECDVCQECFDSCPVNIEACMDCDSIGSCASWCTKMRK